MHDIPVYECYIGSSLDFTYINIDELPDEHRDEFSKWMHDKTKPIVNNCPNAAYLWDWNNWIMNLYLKQS